MNNENNGPVRTAGYGPSMAPSPSRAQSSIPPPTPTPMAAPVAPPTDFSRNAVKQKPKKSKKGYLIFAMILLIAAIAFGAWTFLRSGTLPAQIDGSKYQAVFLVNGQVYFGKLHNMDSDYLKLNDIFYLQTTSKSESSANLQDTNDGADVQLIKLGSEVHGPDDQMVISKSQVLFFENLKNDGKVTESIVKYNNEKK